MLADSHFVFAGGILASICVQQQLSGSGFDGLHFESHQATTASCCLRLHLGYELPAVALALLQQRSANMIWITPKVTEEKRPNNIRWVDGLLG